MPVPSMMIQNFRTVLLSLVVAGQVAGCGGARSTAGTAADASRNARPPVSDQSVSLREPESPYRIVVPGDTLYSIAWESGRDYRELAAWNRIPRPYTIKPGQQLRVQPQEAEEIAPEKSDSKPAPAAAKSSRNTTVAKPPIKSARVVPPAAKKSRPAKPATARNAKPASRKSESGAAGKGSFSGPVGAWLWPADGQTLNRYAESDSKGLDIAGARGAAIRAAASGRVVYQGSGLRGYGQLIIIKHSDEFLSAYAHNDRIFVKEGDAVKRGQKIAEMGSTGADRVKLHFEIRRHGVPIDPLKYLPRR